MPRSNNKRSLAADIETGLRASKHPIDVAIAVDVGLVINLSLDPGEVLAGPKLVRAIMENAADNLWHVVKDYQREDGQYPRANPEEEDDVTPMHLSDFTVIDARVATLRGKQVPASEIQKGLLECLRKQYQKRHAKSSDGKKRSARPRAAR